MRPLYLLILFAVLLCGIRPASAQLTQPPAQANCLQYTGAGGSVSFMRSDVPRQFAGAYLDSGGAFWHVYFLDDSVTQVVYDVTTGTRASALNWLNVYCPNTTYGIGGNIAGTVTFTPQLSVLTP